MEENIESNEIVAQEIKVALDVTTVTKELDLKSMTALCKENDITVAELVELTNNNYAFSDLEKKIKPLKEKVKAMLIGACAKKAMIGQNALTITFQDRSKMDEDALVALLQKKDLHEFTTVVIKPDISRLQELLIDGRLTDKELKSCMVPNWVTVLNFPRRKKGATTTSTESKETVAEKVIRENAKTEKRGLF